ncbi:hypothetical protein [Fluviicola chungangensis]|uniref:Uncharacterized protein n=1 Tax=Fluviicola chungangensis TaxID=2597671 RepID=A0A556MGE5_9FLAO|nr:hypothetical protein [Fluviicola chungangensis]TSJ39007.1 hypothetical protein FO442_18505 [Fluviicola chungangensis]
MNKSILIIAYTGLLTFVLSCESNGNRQIYATENQEELILDSSHNLPFICVIDTPFCTDSACSGMYRGVEFVPERYIDQLKLNGTDVAHQYSNKICEYVGKKLKQLYRDSLYSKVDFNHIRISTKGMNGDSNYVEYKVYIPFKRVPKSQAMTAFDHCGGWGHTPELKKRKFDLLSSPNKIVRNKRLWISRLFKTKEGLQEYWIQWQHTACSR